jgi:DNA-directed RNA polymerase specialized sigma24 family protein
MSMQTYQKSDRKIWQLGVIALSEFSFKKPQAVKKPKLGVDLNKRFHEVKKLFMAQCAKMCIENKCDPEEVLQEVYKGILIRNNGECPYDPSKSAFSTYVVMVAKCVTINYVNKYGARNVVEKHGQEDSIENEPYLLGLPSNLDTTADLNIEEIYQKLKGDAKIVFKDLLDGVKVSQISKIRSLDARRVSRHIEEIKRIALGGI